MLKIENHSVQDTEKLGYDLGTLLFPGSFISLTGDLGAGKTAFTGGLAKGLGIMEYITSPTFTIVNEYQGPIPLYHFDVYRIGSPEEMDDIGFEEYLERDGVIVMEWANLVEAVLPGQYLAVHIRKKPEEGAAAREFTLYPRGRDYEKLIENLKQRGWNL